MVLFLPYPLIMTSVITTSITIERIPKNNLPAYNANMPQLSTLPTNARFRVHGKPFTKLAVLAWDTLRENPDHDLYGVDPQIAPRADAVHCVSEYGVIVLMRPDADVEQLPRASEYAYRVTVDIAHREIPVVLGADTLDAVRHLVRMIGMTYPSLSRVLVAIECEGQHINADGTACREQGKGLQWRAVECRVAVGPVNV